jgi:pimeloyl-ACP methyl ester carboxylesterase
MHTTSADGTRIAYSRAGDGPPLILIDGALCHRAVGPNRRLAERLSHDFTVVTYDRRGRGDSTDTPPYAVAREVEDLAALIDALGDSAHLYGISSGGALAPEAATRLPAKVRRVAVYEIPFVIDDARSPVPVDYREQLERLLAAGRRGAAVKRFMRDGVGFPAPLVALMPLVPGWSKNKASAHTLRYDAAIMGSTQRGRPLAAERWATLTAPVQALAGGKSPTWVRNAAAQLTDALPDATHQVLEGQRHYVKADAIAPVLTKFLAFSAGDRLATPSPTSRPDMPSGGAVPTPAA